MGTLHSSLTRDAADFVGGRWVAGAAGERVESRSPAAPDRVVWAGVGSAEHVDAAVAAARGAVGAWAAWGLEARERVLRKFGQIAAGRVDALAALIRDEVGKPTWDAKAEAQLIANKVNVTLDPNGSMQRVRGYELELGTGKKGRCWFRPHGVMAVVGPFNFPAHLPNGHIVPALAMGNTVVFKPSDKAPACGQMLIEMLAEALEAEKAPAGVVNLVQGGASVAKRLTGHDGIDGVLFTGSWPVGRAIMQANLDRPGRILALEMGGNNAAVVMGDADLKQAVVECVRCAFITAGQRCTCTRRLIVHESVAERVIRAVCEATGAVTVGDPACEPAVFMGPLISDAARRSALDAQRAMILAGGTALVEMKAAEGAGWLVRPGVMRVERFSAGDDIARDGAGADVEVFAPLLRLAVVKSLEEAIEQANATRFGLAASIFTKDAAAAERFFRAARAGCINWNTGTAGASGSLPFGGLGLSGNHRPAGAFSLDYCAYPVAGMVEAGAAATVAAGMVWRDEWII
ncbi:MAG: aldehyde dehydrogenase family protein [Planctomycetes bacterium]|nr:aldehyde dehydrogenase family protein [Planctomycetota bacterium]